MSAPAAVASHPPRPRLARLVRLAVITLGGLHLAVQLAIIAPALYQRTDRQTRDVNQIYTHATMARRGERLYWPWPEYGPDVQSEGGPAFGVAAGRNGYPPFLTALAAPLTRLSFLQFARLWYLLLFGGFWFYAVCLSRLATGRISAAGVLGAGLLLAATPGAYQGLALGNVDPLMWAAVGGALAFRRLRGGGFAAAALVKLFGGWPLLFAWRREGRQVLAGAAAVTGATVAASAAVLGPGGLVRACLDWWRFMLPAISQGTLNSFNVSVSMGGLRLARHLGWHYVSGPLPAWARAYLFVVGVTAPLAVGILARRRSPELQAALVVAAAILAGPICWRSYTPILFAAGALAFREWRSQARRRSVGAADWNELDRPAGTARSAGVGSGAAFEYGNSLS